jgi:hypothetical protein
VKRAREALDGVHHSRRGTIDGVADDYDVAVPHRIKTPPAGTRAKGIDIALRVSRMRACEDQDFRLKPDNFFEADVRPLGPRVHDGSASRAPQRVRNERVAPNRNQWIGPHHEKNAAWRGAVEPAVEIGEAAA